MEAGAEWPSAEGRSNKARVPLPLPVAMQSGGVQSEKVGDCGDDVRIPERSCVQFNTQSEHFEAIILLCETRMVMVYHRIRQ